MRPFHFITLSLVLIVILTACQRDTYPLDTDTDDEEEGLVYRGYEDEWMYLQRYEKFLRAKDRYLEAIRIDSLLRAERYPNGFPTVKDSIDLREKAYMLAKDGVSATYLEILRENGLDITGMDWTRQREGQAATSEIVVRATVQNSFTDRTVRDGYRSTVILNVEDIIKGRLPPHQRRGDILIRRKTGETPLGRYIHDRRELDLEQGGTYLMFLSRAKYEFELQFPDYVWMMDMGEPPLYLFEQNLPEVPAGFVLERYPALRLDWLPASRRDTLLADLNVLRLN